MTKATPSAPCPTVVSMFTVKNARRLPLVEKVSFEKRDPAFV